MSSLIEFRKISPVEQLFNMIPQWRPIEEHVSPVEGKNQVCGSFCVLCVCVLLRVCVWLQVDFLKNLNACLRFFEKSRGHL